ncbi:hypothetical protein GPECTOR_38g266 [Gonium pectorale]|uniref:Uncharacterized protein n=1 Tax=Gonium pectorale TaxID=33097 RepID=A0A150GB27_GONPE|nr:hypothetical protein GPECTOR_38g266 [Gonium pectorale]|eukprot:KXZ47029.1 hypothetical protein GPECTOR_38g266 [Gonium pectorale]
MCDAQQRWRQLPLDVLERIASKLSPNEPAATLRLIDKAASQLRGPNYTTIRLSQPVPPNVFATRWLAPGGMRGLTLRQRRRLVSLTAASGVMPNLEAAMQAAGVAPTYEVFEAAAAAGRLEPCQWLLGLGCERSEGPIRSVLAAAAGAGHHPVCDWLGALDWSPNQVVEAAVAALRGGHAELADWLLLRFEVSESRASWRRTDLTCAVAAGCDLAGLQRYVKQRGWGRERVSCQEVALAAAAGSGTPDWVAKVEWLEARGCRRTERVAAAAARCPDAAARLAWLRDRGYPLSVLALRAAVEAGSAEAVQLLLSSCGPVQPRSLARSVEAASEGGRLAVLQALAAAGYPLDAAGAARRAAHGGQLHVLAWLVAEAPGGAAVELDQRLFAAAGESGSAELLAWLRERGCPWGEDALMGAVAAGCEEALEWLVQRRCPVPSDGSPYVTACRNGDLATLRCLRRLGVGWGWAGTVLEAALRGDVGPAALRWLLEAGCPYSYEEARRVCACWHPDKAQLRQMLEQHHQRREEERRQGQQQGQQQGQEEGSSS